MPTYHDIQQFLFLEARLMDEHRYDDWLALWTVEAHYWIPCRDDDRGIEHSIALVNEDRYGIEDRIKRLKSGAHYAQDPKSQLARVVSNVEIIKQDADAIIVGSAFNLTACRKGSIDIVAGRTTHTLKLAHEAIRMSEKKIMLANHQGVMSNLTYLI
jgi:3-phenylpropionate/cinnamic acid dioxygenase small subunit